MPLCGTKTGMEIVRVSIEDLIPDPDNARHHPEENIEVIRKSLKRFGQAAPLIVHEATSTVVSGNGTLEAMKRLGWTECDIVAYAGTRDEATALGLVMNRSGESSRWTGEKLETLIKDLAAADFQGMDALGFDTGLIEKLVSGDATVDALINVSAYQRSAGSIHPQDEWTGMPEYVNEDKTAFRSIVVHFKDQAAVDFFAELVEQKLSDKTKYIWFPEMEIATAFDKRYEAEPDVPASAAEPAAG